MADLDENSRRLVDIANGLHENMRKLYNYRKNGGKEPEYKKPGKEKGTENGS